MDCVVPGQSIRLFCASLCCLSRVGIEISIDFDPVDGLTLRALSDSRSVFASFHYAPSFFESFQSGSLGRRPKTDEDCKLGSLSAFSTDDRWCASTTSKALAPVVRLRRDVIGLRIRSRDSLLDFQFRVQDPNGIRTHITHSVGLTMAQSVAAVTSMETASEILVEPSVILTMIEPLHKSPEMALLIDDKKKVIAGLSVSDSSIMGEKAARCSNVSMNTEASIGYDELLEAHYSTHLSNPDTSLGPAPKNIADKAFLVFTTKEFRAMLQFCTQAFGNQELPVRLHFYWGGQPIVLKTQHQSFEAEMTMATLDHALLGDLRVKDGSTCA